MEKDSFKFSYKINNKENVSLSVYNTGYQRCEAGYCWGPATRDHYLFHYVTEGEGVLKTDKESFSVTAGGLFLIRPGELVTYTADDNHPWEYYWVGFNGSEAHRLIQLTAFSGGERLLYPDADNHIRRHLKRIYDVRGNGSASEAKMLGGLYLFLGSLMDAVAPDKLRQTTAQQYVTEAIKFISRNFSRDITIEDLADYVGISPSHLYRVFSHELGMPPTQFLTNYRINEACSLLRSSNMTIGAIAASAGFRDPLYFSRVFKKTKGISPTHYAKIPQKDKGDQSNSNFSK